MPPSGIVIEITHNTIEFPSEIDDTHETMATLFQHLEDDGVIVDPQVEGDAEDRALRHSLCG